MKIVQLTTDNRNQQCKYDLEAPYFGTAPEALFEGFSEIPDCEVHVISCSVKPMVSPEKIASNIWFHVLQVPKIGWGRTLFSGAVLATRKLISEINPDIVHGQGTERDCALSAVYSGYPNVLTLHGNMRIHAKHPENRGNVYYKLAAFLEGVALRRTDGVVSISSYTQDLVQLSAKKTWLLPNAADSSYFEVGTFPDTPPIMLFVGSFDERKNTVAYIKACQTTFEKNGWILRLCGAGHPSSDYFRELNHLAEQYAWLEIAGWKSRAELLREMQHASALVLPTLEDNCPMVVLEAMAVGLPVLASKVGGIPDLITNGSTGLLFDPLSPDSMRSTTERFMNDKTLRTNLGEAARQEAKSRFHPRVIAAAHMEIYKEVLNSKLK